MNLVAALGKPWYANGDTSYPCVFDSDVEPDGIGYAKYDLVYIEARIIPQLSRETEIAFGMPYTLEILLEDLKRPETIDQFGRELTPIEFMGKTLYPEISGWNID